MPSTIGANGELFPYPEAGETGWGPDGTNWAIAVSQALTKLGLGGSTTPKAVLNIVSTTAGILVPRMTSLQRDAMFPVTDTSYRGLMIYNLDLDFYQIYDGTAWISPTSIMSMTGNTIPVANASGNALVNSPMTVAGTKVTQAGAMDITGAAGLLGGANLNSQKITSLLAGTAGTDAVNKTQMDAADTAAALYMAVTTGASRAPANTQVKISWYEGTTTSGGSINFNHGLGSNILAFTAYIKNSAQSYYYEVDTNIGASQKRYDDTQLSVALPDAGQYGSQPYRVLVWHK
jgi:hypothetical protein